MKQIHPNHSEQLARLARIEGQIRGIRKMVEDGRYCIDIVTQIRAATSALNKVKLGVLEKHIHHCVRKAVESGDEAMIQEKTNEIVKLMGQSD